LHACTTAARQHGVAERRRRRPGAAHAAGG
jgi:hypothetical protein